MNLNIRTATVVAAITIVIVMRLFRFSLIKSSVLSGIPKLTPSRPKTWLLSLPPILCISCRDSISSYSIRREPLILLVCFDRETVEVLNSAYPNPCSNGELFQPTSYSTPFPRAYYKMLVSTLRNILRQTSRGRFSAPKETTSSFGGSHWNHLVWRDLANWSWIRLPLTDFSVSHSSLTLPTSRWCNCLRLCIYDGGYDGFVGFSHTTLPAIAAPNCSSFLQACARSGCPACWTVITHDSKDCVLF